MCVYATSTQSHNVLLTVPATKYGRSKSEVKVHEVKEQDSVKEDEIEEHAVGKRKDSRGFQRETT